MFLLLFMIQLTNGGQPLEVNAFVGLLVGSLATVGLLYIGYSFPAFRSKERSFSYLTLPASGLEKFLFEFVIRIALFLIVIPLLYWFIFNVEGWFYELVNRKIDFAGIGIGDVRQMKVRDMYVGPQTKVLMVGAGLLVLVLPFTGSAMFNKQPLVKTLFAVALIFLVFFGTAYIVIDPLGLDQYRPPKVMYVTPSNESEFTTLFSVFFVVANLVMLSVAYLKLKEKEV